MHGLFSKILGGPGPPRPPGSTPLHVIITLFVIPVIVPGSGGLAALSMMKRGNPPLVVLRRTDLDIHLFTRKTTA